MGFFFVEPSQLAAVADRFAAAPIGNAGDGFATLAERFGLATDALVRMAGIVAGGAPEAAGLGAAARGLQGSLPDARARLEAAMTLCDAFYVWCRDGAEEVLG